MMKKENLLKFSSVMFFAAATFFLLTAFNNYEYRLIYIVLGALMIILGLFMSAKSRNG